MATKQLNVRLTEELDERLENLARKTGRSKSFYVTEAIEESIEDYEDYFLAKDAIEEFRQSNDEPIDVDSINIHEFEE
ncbi:MAG: TraY domain-containing protein [Cryobacterium sp.]|nr:TraY domain-containing protein [Cryobacterium sp.]MBX3103774.1 TraY domain-containing protein [Cryobacterium sp.]